MITYKNTSIYPNIATIIYVYANSFALIVRPVHGKLDNFGFVAIFLIAFPERLRRIVDE